MRSVGSLYSLIACIAMHNEDDHPMLASDKHKGKSTLYDVIEFSILDSCTTCPAQLICVKEEFVDIRTRIPLYVVVWLHSGTWTKQSTSVMPVSIKHLASSPFIVNGSWSSTVYRSVENLVFTTTTRLILGPFCGYDLKVSVRHTMHHEGGSLLCEQYEYRTVIYLSSQFSMPGATFCTYFSWLSGVCFFHHRMSSHPVNVQCVR